MEENRKYVLRIEFSAPDMAVAEQLTGFITQSLDRDCAPWSVDGPYALFDPIR